MKFVRRASTALSRAKFLAETAWCNGSYSPESAVEHVFSWDSVRPWQTPVELVELAKIVRAQRPRTMVEIGSANGGTLFVWCQMSDPRATLVSIDLPGGEFGGGCGADHLPLLRRLKQSRQTLHLLRTDSHNLGTLARVEGILD